MTEWCTLVLNGWQKNTCADARVVPGNKQMMMNLSSAGTWRDILDAEQFWDLKPNDLTMNDHLGDMEDDNGGKES